jgi:hypothetical protein
MRWFIKTEYSENGTSAGGNATRQDFKVTFVPLLNTFAAIVLLLEGESPYSESYRKEVAKKRNYNKFFGIKKII